MNFQQTKVKLENDISHTDKSLLEADKEIPTNCYRYFQWLQIVC